jgi:hypothetical protein
MVTKIKKGVSANVLYKKGFADKAHPSEVLCGVLTATLLYIQTGGKRNGKI